MSNRLSGLFFTLTGILLLIWFIPHHTETADFGWLKPATLPKILATLMVLTGLLQTVYPTGKTELNGPLILRFTLIFALCLSALLLMKYIGFIFVAPILACVVMFLIGERRPLWLFIGILLSPVSLWAVVTLLLERPLP
jgi:putative tricarboxylic transport membrane protein